MVVASADSVDPLSLGKIQGKGERGLPLSPGSRYLTASGNIDGSYGCCSGRSNGSLLSLDAIRETVATMVPPVSIPNSTWSIPKLQTVWVKEGRRICINQIDPYPLKYFGEGIPKIAMKM